MSAQILSGNEPAQVLLESLKQDVQQLDPLLRIIQIGNNEASNSYIRKKIKSAASIHMRAEHIHLPETCTYNALLELIEDCNNNSDVNGFIIQLPLPAHLQEALPQILRAIDPQKDVDGFCAYNLGKMMLSTEYEHLPPATPAGVITLMEYYNIDISGKHIVVIGRGNTVGKPLAIMLSNRGATVTVCHSKTSNIQQYTMQADIVCTAVGKSNILTKQMIQPSTTVIDIGFNTTNGTISGDSDFEELQHYCNAITPVPGGIGPMTVASLLRNVVTAAKRQAN